MMLVELTYVGNIVLRLKGSRIQDVVFRVPAEALNSNITDAKGMIHVYTSVQRPSTQS
jgi:hypothetical protein